jgi:hypothetical protein
MKPLFTPRCNRAGFVNGVATGVTTGEWNLWEYTWKGAALGAAGGLAYGTFTELGYQAQLRRGRSNGLNSSNTETLAGLAQDGINQFNQEGTVVNGGSVGEITVVYNTSSGTSTVYIYTAPNGYWQPPLPYQYTSPNFDNIIRLLRLY